MKLLRSFVAASILALLLTCGCGAREADTVTLQGTVLLPDGQPVAGARVFVGFYSAAGWIIPEVRTAAAGKFSVDAPLTRRDQSVQVLALQPGFAAADPTPLPPSLIGSGVKTNGVRRGK